MAWRCCDGRKLEAATSKLEQQQVVEKPGWVWSGSGFCQLDLECRGGWVGEGDPYFHRGVV